VGSSHRLPFIYGAQVVVKAVTIVLGQVVQEPAVMQLKLFLIFLQEMY
jgi:hypothetical protein